MSADASLASSTNNGFSTNGPGSVRRCSLICSSIQACMPTPNRTIAGLLQLGRHHLLQGIGTPPTSVQMHCPTHLSPDALSYSCPPLQCRSPPLGACRIHWLSSLPLACTYVYSWGSSSQLLDEDGWIGGCMHGSSSGVSKSRACERLTGYASPAGRCAMTKLQGLTSSLLSQDGKQLKEAQSINKSLSALADVIGSLSSDGQHIPYRNHKLTMLMSDYLMWIVYKKKDFDLEKAQLDLRHGYNRAEMKFNVNRVDNMVI
ncbi:hypothetical protein ZEAMMB73_Zm00001d045759 [Zea mays]|uniref:Kinesin motor domain-containing protein n=1 Tax=Zea mays TaxID=4577 RepID=A0A1D6NYR3_MAIZE|nr:hypothetical protein ZEAMMB73_Zm00001d045759 [Zea mays]AQL03115.1 hypothetical protein ZEAMMB73_Zm00001d045759 [Zea mays]